MPFFFQPYRTDRETLAESESETRLGSFLIECENRRNHAGHSVKTFLGGVLPPANLNGRRHARQVMSRHSGYPGGVGPSEGEGVVWREDRPRWPVNRRRDSIASLRKAFMGLS